MIDLAKKMRAADDFLHHLYVHVNELNQFVVLSGLKFHEFASSVGPLQNILLLKNEFEDGSFNMHTRLGFVDSKSMPYFAKKISDSRQDLCWIDFADEKKLNLLTPQEQAELLYIGHKKEPLRTPFYHQLQNKYVYLENKEEQYTKIYFSNLEDNDRLVVNVFNNVIQLKERQTSFWRRRVATVMPHFTVDVCDTFREHMKDGALFSMYRIEKPTVAYVLEVRNIADIHFADEIWDDLNTLLKQKPDGVLEVHK